MGGVYGGSFLSLLCNVAGGRGTRSLHFGSNEDAEQHDLHAGR